MVTKNELTKVIHDFSNHDIKHEYLILNGNKIDANLAYKNIYETAQKSIFVIDNYIGIKSLVLLKNTKKILPLHFLPTILANVYINANKKIFANNILMSQ